MAILRIEYDAGRRRALLSMEAQGFEWSQVRRACEDHSADVEDLGPGKISLPWWGFLSSRAAINFYVGRHHLDVKFDQGTRALLEKSNQKSQNYKDSATAVPIDTTFITEELKKRGFIRSLTDQQLRNVSRLAAMRVGATFSVPGAGKTTEALAYYWLLHAPDSRLLVACPKNAFAVWEEQIRLCIPTFGGEIVRLTGGERNIRALLEAEPDVSLITYQQLPNVVGAVAEYLSSHPVFIFVDESHKIKRGSEGVWAASILSLAHLAEQKLILSGTPMPQAQSDLVPQFQFLYPEVKVDEESVVDFVKPIYVRTTKQELNLPKVTRVAVPVPLSNEQRYLYDLLRSEVAREANKEIGLKQRSQLRRVGRAAVRMLQFVSNPMLLASSGALTEDLLGQLLASGDSPKIELACKRARQLAASGKKSIIWSTFVQNVELLAYRLSDLGADFIHGGVETGSEEEDETREKKILRFHEDSKAFILVANPAACGEGISLHTVCHHAIYLDRNFNAAQYLQSEDRIHRLGLKPDQETLVEILVAPDTIDEVVDIRLRAKVNRMAAVLEDSSLNIDPVTLDPDDESLDDDDIRLFLDHLVRKAVEA